MSKRDKRTAIGIDLGTTYACAALWIDNKKQVEIIPNEQGNKITPSCLAFNDIELLVGEGAKNQIARNPTNTVFGNHSRKLFFKRLNHTNAHVSKPCNCHGPFGTEVIHSSSPFHNSSVSVILHLFHSKNLSRHRGAKWARQVEKPYRVWAESTKQYLQELKLM
ncbi:heat shock protein 70 family [Artemisia annua]|uniref:Heat shock protein 70 family n=1 Tax=Artemisia annua TaxID=35608 RepID=A0A2U1L3W1_ARTAN|nr:heat shock protein 70 family [Artemisia annua]